MKFLIPWNILMFFILLGMTIGPGDSSGLVIDGIAIFAVSYWMTFIYSINKDKKRVLENNTDKKSSNLTVVLFVIPTLVIIGWFLFINIYAVARSYSRNSWIAAHCSSPDQFGCYKCDDGEIFCTVKPITTVTDSPKTEPVFSVDVTNKKMSTIRGWLRNGSSGLYLQEIAPDYNQNNDNDAYSGRTFSIRFNDKSACYMYRSINSMTSIQCSSLNEGKGSVNNRVIIIGPIDGNRIDAITLKDMSNLPVSQWNIVP